MTQPVPRHPRLARDASVAGESRHMLWRDLSICHTKVFGVIKRATSSKSNYDGIIFNFLD